MTHCIDTNNQRWAPVRAALLRGERPPHGPVRGAAALARRDPGLHQPVCASHPAVLHQGGKAGWIDGMKTESRAAESTRHVNTHRQVYDWNLGPAASDAAGGSNDSSIAATANGSGSGSGSSGGPGAAASSSPTAAAAGGILAPDQVPLAAAAAAGPPATFFERVTRDIEIVRVALLLTGCVQGAFVVRNEWENRSRGPTRTAHTHNTLFPGIRNTVQEYLGSFGLYDWLWRDDKDHFYHSFVATGPAVDAYKERLEAFDTVCVWLIRMREYACRCVALTPVHQTTNRWRPRSAPSPRCTASVPCSLTPPASRRR